MSGHSKWAQIKRQKGVTDARRGQLFTKLAREITVAVHQGGASPETNFRLRLAIQRARDQNMPLENVERALKRGSGELGEGGASLAEMNMEGYGSHGIAILLQAVTDNRNRILQEVRNILSRGGGSLGDPGCVLWLFDSKGVITVVRKAIEQRGVSIASAELSMIPKTVVQLDDKASSQTLRLLDQLEELDGVQRVFSNADFSDAALEQYRSKS